MKQHVQGIYRTERTAFPSGMLRTFFILKEYLSGNSHTCSYALAICVAVVKNSLSSVSTVSTDLHSWEINWQKQPYRKCIRGELINCSPALLNWASDPHSKACLQGLQFGLLRPRLHYTLRLM